MAALPLSPVTLHSKLPLSTSSAAFSPAVHSLSPSLRSSASISSFSSLHLRDATHHRRRRRQPGAGGATMMDTAAGSYAAALAEVAKSTGTLEATVDDMEKVAKVFSDPPVLRFFTDPTIKVEKKQNLIDDIASSANLQPHTSNFLHIVVDMKRTDLIGEIAEAFEAAFNKITGTEVAVVSSVVPLDSMHLAQMAKAVQRLTRAKNVRIKTSIDPSLVAGFTIRYGSSCSKLIDMSVRKQLEEISRQLEFNVDLVGSPA